MSYDVSACGVFGVVPDGWAWAKLKALYDEEAAGGQDEEVALERVKGLCPDLVETLRLQYAAPPQATVHLSAGEDTFLFGVGLFEMHEVTKWEEEWLAVADYHTWCEGG